MLKIKSIGLPQDFGSHWHDITKNHSNPKKFNCVFLSKPMKNKDKPQLLPEHFKIGKISGSPRDFSKGKKTHPRGGVDLLEYWYSEDPEMSEYLDEDFQKNIEQKIEKLKQEGWDPSKQFFYACTQSHLDLGWRWRFRQGIAKAEHTFHKVHGHFKHFSPFTFTGSQPAQYQWVKYDSPDIFEEIKEDVKSGRHELQGGCWCEADGRIGSGESWVRQRLYGQLFYARNFGKIANVSWFPDSFGYANNLPQIFRKSGATGFQTSKLTANKQTKWPFWAWIWESPDGSRLLSYLTGNHNKLGPLGGFDVEQNDSDVRESYVNSYRLLKEGKKLIANYETDKPEDHETISNEEIPFIGCFFGEGDGGHGPQGIEMAVYRGYAERGHVKWASTREIFDELEKYKDRLPVWKDELYFQFHRGSLTTQTMMKRMNRYFEWHLPVVEGVYTLAKIVNPEKIQDLDTYYAVPSDQVPTADSLIEMIWENTLLMQFHDVLPGTSVPEVYDECYEMWHQDLPYLTMFKNESLTRLAEGLNVLSTLSEVPFQINVDNNDHDFLVIPIFLMNGTGADAPSCIEIPTDEFNGLTPLSIISFKRGGKDLKSSEDDSRLEFLPIQAIEGDRYCFELDKKPRRYIFQKDVPSWGYDVVWCVACPDDLEEDFKAQLRTYIQKSQGNYEMSQWAQISRDEKAISIKSPDVKISINKENGDLQSIIYQGNELLQSPSGLRSFVNKPYKEACWNMMKEWWKHPKDPEKNLRVTSVQVLENGPIEWRIRVSGKYGENSELYTDYYIRKGKEGFGVDIGFDFHERETFIKYILSHNLNSEYSIAETPYATSKRKNQPNANHDKPRWEKWMHTFVTLEDEGNETGMAVLNDGKYGFDTINNHLGISIVHGPKYPKPDVVSWVREERRARKKRGLGNPPTLADQGENLTRLWVLPYQGTWKSGKIHRMAHKHNAPTSYKLLKSPEFSKKKSKISFFDKIEESFSELKSSLNPEDISGRFIYCDSPTAEITVLKNGEEIPNCLQDQNNIGDILEKESIVFRVVNNIDEKSIVKIGLPVVLTEKATQILETDLLERIVGDGLQYKIPQEKSATFYLECSLNPHEIKTFKILLNTEEHT